MVLTVALFATPVVVLFAALAVAAGVLLFVIPATAMAPGEDPLPAARNVSASIAARGLFRVGGVGRGRLRFAATTVVFVTRA